MPRGIKRRAVTAVAKIRGGAGPRRIRAKAGMATGLRGLRGRFGRPGPGSLLMRKRRKEAAPGPMRSQPKPRQPMQAGARSGQMPRARAGRVPSIEQRMAKLKNKGGDNA